MFHGLSLPLTSQGRFFLLNSVLREIDGKKGKVGKLLALFCYCWLSIWTVPFVVDVAMLFPDESQSSTLLKDNVVFVLNPKT